MTFLKNPFWNHEIRDRSTSLASIWKTFDDIFEVESTADSFLDIASLQLALPPAQAAPPKAGRTFDTKFSDK